MKFDIITIFPKIFGSYFDESIIKRARKNDLIDIKIHNLRDYTYDKHRTVDDTPYGGGPGMILKIEPIYKAVQNILDIQNVQSKKNTTRTISTIRTTRTILFSAKGKKYSQADARRLSKYKNLILICGRYEGVDERVAKHIADEEISIGDYVLTGGEIPAMILVDSITRLLPGVLGNIESLAEESFSKKIPNTKYQIPNTCLEYPQYTRPEEFQNWKVPSVLLSGNHKKINEWRSEKIRAKKKNV
ncbi:MAG: tRNA (guanosine(37)-N1)-methyltransferase TrmD [Candidatus Moranbacteria bacterium RIFCSPHIGHO2_02_FULL_40_12b]|nr:MAG: tRNA (guanosine(37)-N1)-methyltransferase TrmD [Candidatus Moranbacteria bacterium RIFCSPHIGHO2_02_FULL_40_12b]OGI23771.1 MAG: tRNA (guanosine(37)-N1)-methyltransferase TrmD [Candidatus Moranbacteria bacterium RIFCSPHIGHO2_12_FULL_40_10]